MNALKKKAGPLPVWGWLVLAGGTIGVVVLIKRGKGETKPAGEAEVPQTLGAGGAAAPEVAGSGGGATAGAPDTKTPSPEGLATPTPQVGYEAGGFAREANDVREGAEALEALGIVVPAGGANTSAAAQAPAQARHAATGGNPRAGLPFKSTTYRGMNAHEYQRAVPGGVGPGRRFIILGGPSKRTHAAQPSHAPAHAKGKAPAKHPTKATHAPAPRHVPSRPAPHAPAHKPAAKPKPKRRR